MLNSPTPSTREEVAAAAVDMLLEAKRTGATILVVAESAGILRELTDRAESAGMGIAVTSMGTQIKPQQDFATSVSDIDVGHLIGRDPVETNDDQRPGYIAGRRVLVTGAGGSIGLELCRQLSIFGPSEMIMLDRDETGLQLAQLATSGRGLLDTKDVVLADIREPATLMQLFIERKPEVVFHAAALKHLPMLEQYPDEAWKTNVLGTLNVIEAARAVGVTTFVNLSTDKAANPTSVLGSSKHLAERLTAWAGQVTGERYLSVRFGNVLGSRGSVLPTFKALIELGGPVTVTHPDVTRYFMTMTEACQLVIQGGATGRSGEVLILDMGDPVSILGVAKRLIEASGKPVDVVFTGLRRGEKLREELVGDGEKLERHLLSNLSYVRAEVLEPHQLDRARWARGFTRHLSPMTNR